MSRADVERLIASGEVELDEPEGGIFFGNEEGPPEVAEVRWHVCRAVVGVPALKNGRLSEAVILSTGAPISA